MNDECFNRDQLVKVTNSHKYISFYDDANNNPSYYFDKVFEVVTATNMCDQLKLSLFDILDLDYASFQRIKEKIIKIDIEKSEIMKNLSSNK